MANTIFDILGGTLGGLSTIYITMNVLGNLRGESNDIPQIQINVPAIENKINSEVREALESQMDELFNEIVANTPCDTGTLVSSYVLSNNHLDESDFGGETIYEAQFEIQDILNPKSNTSTQVYFPMIEDGHMLVDGGWFEGYHMLSDAIASHEGAIYDSVSESLKRIGIS